MYRLQQYSVLVFDVWVLVEECGPMIILGTYYKNWE